LAKDNYESIYARAERSRNFIRQDFQRVFREVDILATPTTISTAFPLGSKASSTANPEQLYAADLLTVSANLGGLCALSMPCGWSEASPKLPIGLQLMGAPFMETHILRAAYALEQALC
jgi:aspartyl-tRNA(Asn)/glutamyl-tRNA(Gln) amidotransferase subunit A